MKNSLKNKRCWLYVRVAGSDMDGMGRERQTCELKRFALTHGMTVVGVTLENCYGRGLERPGLQELAQTAANADMDVLLVWRFDRISRNVPEGITFIQRLNARGVVVLSVLEEQDVAINMMKTIATHF